MANPIFEALGATGMSLGIYCGGMSYVGISLTGSWVGTVRFFGSVDGVNFIPVSVTPFASGTAVTSATANGNWFLPVGNFVVIKAVFTRTSGTVTVKMATSIDSSYQDAFLLATSIFQNSTQTAATNTLTIAGQANRAWRLRTLVVSVSGGAATWAASPNLTIKDGTTLLWGLDIPVTDASNYNIPLPADPKTPGVSGGGIITTPGNALVIAMVSGGGAVVTNINAEVRAA